MYGTVFHMRPKQGQAERVATLFDKWWETESTRVEGVIAGYLFSKDADPGELIGVAVFEDKTTYMANADSPEQDAWYQEIRELLEADPVWEDGSIVSHGLARAY